MAGQFGQILSVSYLIECVCVTHMNTVRESRQAKAIIIAAGVWCIHLETGILQTDMRVLRKCLGILLELLPSQKRE